MGFRIASFNIQKFSWSAVKVDSTGETRKDLDTIAKIIRNNAFDIVAIQEIYHKEALKELLEKLSGQYADVLKRGNHTMATSNIGSRMNDSYGYRTKHWEGRWAQPISYYGGNNIAEGYAFIWNRDRIQLVTNMLGEAFEPRIADFGNAKQLARPPFIGRFMPINGRYEIRLINTHIVYALPSKKLNEDDDSEAEYSQTDIKDYELRRNEFDSIIRTIYSDYAEQVFDKTGHDKLSRGLVMYTFMLGDYNLNLPNVRGQSSAKLTEESGKIDIISRKKTKMNIVTVNDKLTTLRGKPKDPDKAKLLKLDPDVEHHLANNYDHFSYDVNKLTEHDIAQPDVGTILAFEEYQDTELESRYDIYRTKVSDHIPIYLDFDVLKRV